MPPCVGKLVRPCSSVACAAGVLILTLAGCVSTQDRFENGLRLEAEGRPLEAAHAYIEVLEREPDWPGARERLAEVGARAVEQLMSEARADVERADYVPAFEALIRLEELRARAVGVGISLAVPDDYGRFHAETREAAVRDLVARGDDLADWGRWIEALDAYGRARGYAVEPEQERELTERMAGVYLSWAHEALDHEDYQTAIDKTESVIGLVGPRHPLGREALALAEEATALATRWVAFLPVAAETDLEESSAGAFAYRLSDLLLAEYWSNPPLYMEPVNSRELSRELRRRRAAGRVIGARGAASIGRAVGADLVVLNHLTKYEIEEGDPRETVHRARLEISGEPDVDTVWIEQRFRLQIEASVTYRILDVVTARSLHSGSADAEASGEVRRGMFSGDFRDLRLSSRDRRLLDGEAEREAIRVIQERLADELAEELADKIFRAPVVP